jgi:hypothetical protein
VQYRDASAAAIKSALMNAGIPGNGFFKTIFHVRLQPAEDSADPSDPAGALPEAGVVNPELADTGSVS